MFCSIDGLMRIVQVAAEFAPVAKAGGLGEVVLGISKELIAQHHQVDVILPKYAHIDPNSLQDLAVEIPEFHTQEKGRTITNTAWSARFQDCPLHLLEPHHEANYFGRGKIYGYPDDILRFLYFSRSVMVYLSKVQRPIDVLHLHDWHTAVCAPLLRDLFSSNLQIGCVLLTIHNLEYQGKCGFWDLDAIGMNGASYLTPEKMQDSNPLYPQTINLLKGGILYADAVNTVSPTYAEEILSKEMGCGLSDVLRKKKVQGILNGIDKTTWNPANDSSLAARYDVSDSLLKIRAAKTANKELIQKRFGLQSTERPLVGAITRLVPQKGLLLLIAAIEITLEKGGSFALLGSSPIPEIQQQFDELKEKYKNNPYVLLEYNYSEELAHQLYAAFDFILVPSLFEPCGLTQLIGLRYGAIPIVRSTGGLRDTVFDCEDGKIPLEKRNGFVFQQPTQEALRNAVHRALAFWHTDKASFLSMLRRAMQVDSSWVKPAKEYIKLYGKISRPQAPESAFLINKRFA